MTSIIKLEHVDKIYDSGIKVQALKNINIEIKEKEFVAILGQSGSGKSTLMNLLGCLDKPTNGKIHLLGHDIARMSDDNLAKLRGKEIGFVFQSFNLYPTLTVEENLELAMKIHDFAPSTIKHKTEKLLKLVRMEHRKNHFPRMLSGGEKQRTAIARALSTDPKIILADEPTGNIDSKTGKEIMDFLKNLNKEGVTIIVVTHNKDTANYAERKIILKDGEIEG